MSSVRSGVGRSVLGELAAAFVLSIGLAGVMPSAATAEQPRIVGGTPATIQQAPWTVALVVSPQVAGGSAFQRHFCGGALVAPTIVLTAAHCMYDAEEGRFRSPGFFSVVSGRTTLSSSEGTETPVSDYAVFLDSAGNPLYQPGSNRWDVAVVVLASPAAGSPVKLAGPGVGRLSAQGAPALATGWGQQNGSAASSKSDTMLSARLSVLPDSSCASLGYDAALMLCAGAPGVSPCYGDSGGPLVSQADATLRLIGVVSKGPELCPAGGGVVFTRVSSDPIRAAVRATVLELTGIDVVASGEPVMGKRQARRVTLRVARRGCRRDARCVGSDVGRCSHAGPGFRCLALKRVESRDGGRHTCRRTVVVGDGSPRLGPWRCP